jgi:hypothetical protein
VPNGTWSAAAYRESLLRLHHLAVKRAYFSHDVCIWQEMSAA